MADFKEARVIDLREQDTGGFSGSLSSLSGYSILIIFLGAWIVVLATLRLHWEQIAQNESLTREEDIILLLSISTIFIIMLIISNLVVAYRYAMYRRDSAACWYRIAVTFLQQEDFDAALSEAANRFFRQDALERQVRNSMSSDPDDPKRALQERDLTRVICSVQTTKAWFWSLHAIANALNRQVRDKIGDYRTEKSKE